MRNFLVRLFENAMARNKQNILAFVGDARGAALLDLGCDDGAWTKEVARAAGALEIDGVEIVDDRAALASDRGINAPPK